MKNRLAVMLAFVVGAVLGAALARPAIVHAELNRVIVRRVPLGTVTNIDFSGTAIVGFACTADACYLAEK